MNEAQNPPGGASIGGITPIVLLFAAAMMVLLPSGQAMGQSATLVAAILAVCAVLLSSVRLRARSLARRASAVMKAVQNDPRPLVLTDPAGRVQMANRAGARVLALDDDSEVELASLLRGLVADPGRLTARLMGQLGDDGHATEDGPGHGGRSPMTVHRAGDDLLVWHLPQIVAAPPEAKGGETQLPMLTASGAGTILYMNAALRDLVGKRVRTLGDLFVDPPEPDGAEEAGEGEARLVRTSKGEERFDTIEIPGPGGRREIHLLPPGGAPAAGRGADGMFGGLAALPVPVIRIADDGLVDGGNPAAVEALGATFEEPMPLDSLVEGLGRSITDWVADALEGRGLGHSEVLRARCTPSETYLQVTFGQVRDAGGLRLVAVLNDATELKTLEAQFVQSQKMQAIGQLAGGIAHDFNNLLTAISGHCDLLMLRHDQGDPDHGDLTQISQNANRAASLVGQLLAFSRKQNLSPETLDLRDTLADLAHLLNRLVGETVRLSVQNDPALAPIRADKRQLEQVLMNLVVNARDALGETGGLIEIETANRTLRRPLRRDNAEVPPGPYVVVSVMDRGSGIPADKLPKIFEPFFTTKPTGEGTGLGLSTAYGIVKQSGGFIFVDSEVGTGTTFTLYFPVHQPKQAARPASMEPSAIPVSAPPTAGEGVVLLVEDEAPVRAFASRALRLRGYTVVEADCAEAALALLSDDALKVDLFATDVIMPGMDGPSWVRAALEDRPATPVVFMSGYAEDALEGAEDLETATSFLPKPYSLNDLTATVHDRLHGSA